MPISTHGYLKRELLVVNIPFELILRKGSFLGVGPNPSILARKTKPVIAKLFCRSKSAERLVFIPMMEFAVVYCMQIFIDF